MSTDAGSPIPDRPTPRLDLPRILELRIRRVPVDAPELEHFESSLARYDEAIEFLVETDGQIPARAYGPALFVGDAEVRNSQRIGDTTWRFLEYDTDRLERGAPISWGWMKDPADRRERTDYSFSPDTDAG